MNLCIVYIGDVFDFLLNLIVLGILLVFLIVVVVMIVV